MKISTKGRYALRIMIYLADFYAHEYVSITTLAEKETLSPKYLEKILSKLIKNKFVVSSRGAHGGYKLKTHPKNYTVGQILRVVEGELCPVPCLAKNAKPCIREKDCVTIEIWKRIHSSVKNVIDNLTLIDLLKIQEKKQGIPSLYLTYLLHKKNYEESLKKTANN